LQEDSFFLIKVFNNARHVLWNDFKPFDLSFIEACFVLTLDLIKVSEISVVFLGTKRPSNLVAAAPQCP